MSARSENFVAVFIVEEHWAKWGVLHICVCFLQHLSGKKWKILNVLLDGHEKSGKVRQNALQSHLNSSNQDWKLQIKKQIVFALLMVHITVGLEG